MIHQENEQTKSHVDKPKPSRLYLDEVWPESIGQLKDGDVLDALSRRRRPVGLRPEGADNIGLDVVANGVWESQPPLLVKMSCRLII